MLMKVLVLSPHTDDGSLGVGGTMYRLRCRGVKVLNVAFSLCRKSVPEKFPSDVHREEFLEACRRLGVEAIVLDYPNRVFPSIRQRICQEIYNLRLEYDPDVVFCPHIQDSHQDHWIVAREALSVFKRDTSILMYEIMFNCPTFTPNVYFTLSREDVEKKIEALKAYKSIWGTKRFPHLTEEFILASARFRGLQFNTEYAEAFYTPKMNLLHWMG